MAVERLAGSLSFLPLSSWHLYIGSYPQTSFLCEALPGPRRWLSPVPPAHLWLPAHHPEPGTLCFCACLPPGLGAPRRQDHPPLLSEPQGPVSLSLPRASFRSCPRLPAILYPGPPGLEEAWGPSSHSCSLLGCARSCGQVCFFGALLRRVGCAQCPCHSTALPNC